MKVKTDIEGLQYVIAGKEYEVISYYGNGLFDTKLESGMLSYCVLEGCAYLNGGNWEVIENVTLPDYKYPFKDRFCNGVYDGNGYLFVRTSTTIQADIIAAALNDYWKKHGGVR